MLRASYRLAGQFSRMDLSGVERTCGKTFREPLNRRPPAQANDAAEWSPIVRRKKASRKLPTFRGEYPKPSFSPIHPIGYPILLASNGLLVAIGLIFKR